MRSRGELASSSQLTSYRCLKALASLKMYRNGKLGSVSLLASMQPNHTATKSGNPARALLTWTPRSCLEYADLLLTFVVVGIDENLGQVFEIGDVTTLDEEEHDVFDALTGTGVLPIDQDGLAALT